MRYVLLAYRSEGRSEGLSEGWHELEDVAMATSVRVRDDATLVTDGPFGKAEEHLSAFRLIDVESLDEAIAVAERVPSAQHGVVEIRPVVRRKTEAAA